MKILDIKKAALALIDEEYEEHTSSTGDPSLDVLLQNAINTAYTLLGHLSDAPQTTVSVTISNSGPLPSDFINFISLRDPVTGLFLSKNDFRYTDQYLTLLNTAYQTKQLELTYESSNMAMNDDQTIPSIKEHLHYGLVLYAQYECLMYKKRDGEAVAKLNLFNALVQSFLTEAKKQAQQQSGGTKQ